MRRLLIVEDNEEYATGVSDAVSDLFAIDIRTSVHEAIQALQAKPYDVVLTDYMLQGSSGLELVSYLEALNPTPRIVMMTGFADKDMAIAALNSGVSHLLEKPFTVSRIREVLGVGDADKAPARSAVRFDALTNSVIWKGETLRLTPSEYLLLSYLTSHENAWISRDEIEKVLWKENPHVSRNILDTHIYNLRKKIPDLNTQLSVVRGKGFSLKSFE
ncbi:MAG: response regulator transcription factor [Bdellovibrionales bacterium]|nr:response regulator transcription factor [Bdellovibrionales bacterium]